MIAIAIVVVIIAASQCSRYGVKRTISFVWATNDRTNPNNILQVYFWRNLQHGAKLIDYFAGDHDAIVKILSSFCSGLLYCLNQLLISPRRHSWTACELTNRAVAAPQESLPRSKSPRNTLEAIVDMSANGVPGWGSVRVAEPAQGCGSWQRPSRGHLGSARHRRERMFYLDSGALSRRPGRRPGRPLGQTSYRAPVGVEGPPDHVDRRRRRRWLKRAGAAASTRSIAAKGRAGAARGPRRGAGDRGGDEPADRPGDRGGREPAADWTPR